MTAVPIISGVLGVAGIIQQNNAQNAAAAQQNASINAQISGNKRLMEMQRVQNQFQRDTIAAQDRVGRIMRQVNYETQQTALAVTGEQSNRQTQNDIANIENTNAQFGNQLEYGRQQARQQRDQTRNELTQELSQIYQNFAQEQQAVQQGLAGAANNQRQQRRELGNLSAQLAALGGQGRSRSRQIRLTPDIEEALQAIEQGRQIDAELQQRIVQSNEFADLYRQIASQNYEMQLAELGGVQDAANRESQAAILLRQAQNTQAQNAIRTGQEALQAGNQVDNAQARLNRLFADASLESQGQLTAAQTSAQNAYLESQRQAQRSAFLPILSTLLQTGAGVYAVNEQQRIAGMTPNIAPSAYNPSSNSNLMQRPLLTDVIGLNNYYG